MSFFPILFFDTPQLYYNSLISFFYQAVKEEHKHEDHGHKATEDYPDLLTGPFGTKDKPVVVKSVFNERIVGCVGMSL